MTDCPWQLCCVECAARYDGLAVRYRCECGGTLDVEHHFASGITRSLFDARRASGRAIDRSGVWRFRELILPGSEEFIVTRGEGSTHLYDAPAVAQYTGMDSLRLKHEGENPTGSFKDRGMTAGVTMARRLGMTRVAVASTGNTSASAASYAAIAGMRAYVIIPDGQIAFGKLSQALAYGAKTVQIRGDFDDAMRLVEEVCDREGIYLLNSINPFRIEGQKAIGLEILQDLDWEVPDWIVLPGGNLGNNTAIAKAMEEALELGLIDRLPRIAVIQAAGANPLYQAWHGDGTLRPVKADTVATAIKIGNPVSFTKSLTRVRRSGGVVEQVTDREILEAKAQVDAAGIGAEPASCATVAGLRKLVEAGVIGPEETVIGVLTGHLLKDPDVVINYHQSDATYANHPVQVEATYAAVAAAFAETPTKAGGNV
jgi:threonine synthase